MKELNLIFDVYSPRWGHTDDYHIIFTREKISISNGNFSAECNKDEFGYYHWTGYEEKNSLMKIFSNDMIYAPAMTPHAIERAWDAWLEGTPDEVVSQGLKELFEWVDLVSRNKPSSDFWINHL